jgi:hypothetical protein
MTFSIARFLSYPDGTRTFFSRQGLLFVVAVALYAVLWVTNVRGSGTGFVSVLLYTLIIGNLTTPIMNHLAPFSSRLRFPFDWVAYLILLLLTAVACASLTVTVVMVLYGASFDSFFAQLWSMGKFVVIVILIVGSVRHLYEESRVRLRARISNFNAPSRLEIRDRSSKSKSWTKHERFRKDSYPKRFPRLGGWKWQGRGSLRASLVEIILMY